MQPQFLTRRARRLPLSLNRRRAPRRRWLIAARVAAYVLTPAAMLAAIVWLIIR